MRNTFLSFMLVAAGILPASAITVKSPAAGARVKSPFVVTANTSTCGNAASDSMGYSIDNGPTTFVSNSFSVNVQASQGNHTLHVKCWGHNTHDSKAVALVVIPSQTAAAAPAISPRGGSYISTQNVALAASTPGAAIYYTLDGSAPSTASYRYVTAIPVSSNETINAIAVAQGYNNSAIASANYTIAVPAATPSISLPAGNYTGKQTVSISDTTQGAAIYYTLNGATPTAGSSLYTSPISISSSQTLTAIAIAKGYSNSATASAAYTIKNTTGPTIPDNAIIADNLHTNPKWKWNHDAGTKGTSFGNWSVVSNPSVTGTAADFDSGFSNWGGEIYHLSYGYDAEATNFVYDAKVYIAAGSVLGILEMDMNQVIPNGDTVIYGFQCDGDHGTWDTTAVT